jgi:Protein of unknown function (DUF3119)
MVMIKLFILAVASTLLVGNDVAAFSPSVKRGASSLPMASTVGVNDGAYRNKKPFSTPKSTTPVPAKKVNWIQKQMLSDVMIDPDFSLTWTVALLGPLIWWYHPCESLFVGVSWHMECAHFSHITNTFVYVVAYAVDGTPSLIGIFGGGFHILFSALLWVQTSRVRCVFEKDSFEFYNIKGPRLDLNKGAKLVRKPDNYVSGTRNRWKYDKIINYGKRANGAS